MYKILIFDIQTVVNQLFHGIIVWDIRMNEILD